MAFNGKKVVVTGGAGFIGSHACAKLLEHGNEVVCFDDLSTGRMENIREFEKNSAFSFVKGSVLDNGLEKILDGADYVFHYAAVVGVKRTIEQPLDVLNVNILGTKNVLEKSLEAGVKKVVFASSSEVYGQPVEIPEREEGHVNAKQPYAVSKLVGERYCQSFTEKKGLKTVSLRFFNVYGPRQDSTPYGFVVGIFIEQALKGKPLTVFGDGSDTRDFVYIGDNIEASILACEKNSANGEVLNLGYGRPATILDLAETIIQLAGSNSKIDFLPSRKEEIHHRFPDVSKSRRLLGYRCKWDFKEGLRKTIEYYKQKATRN